MAQHEIVVGNIGSVYGGTSQKKAQKTYAEYCEQSQSNYGRAAGENVTWLVDHNIYKEMLGTLEEEEGE